MMPTGAGRVASSKTGSKAQRGAGTAQGGWQRAHECLLRLHGGIVSPNPTRAPGQHCSKELHGSAQNAPCAPRLSCPWGTQELWAAQRDVPTALTTPGSTERC